MSRAERRRQAREQKKAQREQDKAQGQDSDPCANGHPEQARAWLLHGIHPIKCLRCGETPQFGEQGDEFLKVLSEAAEHSMPEKATRQWVVANSIKDELGRVIS